VTTACPLCTQSRLAPFITRRGVPVHQNLPAPSREAARSTARGDLTLAACLDCGFVTNTTFDERLVDYGEAYDNDQSCSERFDGYVGSLVDGMVADGVKGKRVLEIGCGKGYFLRRICQAGDNSGLGVDSTYVGPLVADGGRVRFTRERFRPTEPQMRADAIVCRHVIEHVPDPSSLLGALGAGMEPGSRAYFETPELGWILDNVVVQDFFYEHCSYFTAESLAFAFRRAGMRPRRVEHVFQGQYLWLVAEPAERAAAPAPPEPPSLDRIQSYQARERVSLERWRDTLASAAKQGGVAVWGGGAKGVTFLNMLDPDCVSVDCAVDINERKQGRYVPGTGHPIVAPADLAARSVRHLVVMNPNYEGEIRRTVDALGLSLTFHGGNWE
jgi:SAM-dependent methyltransferase